MKTSIRWTAQRAAAVLDSIPGTKFRRVAIANFAVPGTELRAGGRAKKDGRIRHGSALVSSSSSLLSSSSRAVEETSARGKSSIKTLGFGRRDDKDATCQLHRRVGNLSGLTDGPKRDNGTCGQSTPSSLAAQSFRRSYRNFATCHHRTGCALALAATDGRQGGSAAARGAPCCHALSHGCAASARFHTAASAASTAEAIQAAHAEVPVKESSHAEGNATSSADRPTWHAHVDFKYVRDKRDQVLANVRARNSNADVDKVVALYEEFARMTKEVNDLCQQRNAVAKQMNKTIEEEKRVELIEQGKQLKDQVAALEAELSRVTDELQREGQKIPNATHPEVPRGGEENAVLRGMVGLKPDFSFKPKDHMELGKNLDLIDFDSAAEASGQKFYYLKNEAVLLELALINWSVSQLVARGFTPLSTPDLVRSAVVEKCGFQPRASNTQVYSVEGMDLCLAGTAEIPVGGMFMDKILSEADLPLKLVAFSHCFRTEAGAPGVASRGLYRVHQFSKAEMFAICQPKDSEEILEELISIEEEMFGSLGLHFKTLDMPSEDLGAPAYRKFDVEAWMPGLCRYGEISSASNCTDYQARRLNIRYRPTIKDAAKEVAEEGQGEAPDANQSKKKSAKKKPVRPASPQFVHTLNATACAVPRMIIAILENFQRKDGSVLIPEPLRPFMGGRTVISPRAEGSK